MARYCPYCTSLIEQGTVCLACDYAKTYSSQEHQLIVLEKEPPFDVSYGGVTLNIDTVVYDITNDRNIVCYVEGTKVSGSVINSGALRFKILDEDGNFLYLERIQFPFIKNGERFSTVVSTNHVFNLWANWYSDNYAGLKPGITYTLVIEGGKYVSR